MAGSEMIPRAAVQPPMIQGLAEVIIQYLQPHLEEPKRQIMDLTGRVDGLERRMDMDGLTRSQGRAVQKAVGLRAHEIARTLNASVHQHFANVYGGLKDRYNTPSYLDIPRSKFLEALQIVAQYDGSSRSWWRD